MSAKTKTENDFSDEFQDLPEDDFIGSTTDLTGRATTDDLVPPSPDMKTLHLVVPNLKERIRIDKFLTMQVANATRNKVQHAINEGRVLVNNRPTTPNYKLNAADEIVVTFTSPKPPDLAPENIPLDIIFEDDSLIVINKAAGMVVHPAYANWTGTLANAVLYHTNQLSKSGDDLRPGIVHRLDKDTSGLIVVAKNDEVHFALARQFANRTTEKIYTALVWGLPKVLNGTVRTNIGRSVRNRKKMAVYDYECPIGKTAVTDYTVTEAFQNFAVIDFQLHTGRTHQIRVHAEYLGHPIVSDPMYGGGTMRFGNPTAKYKAFVDNLFAVIPRQALHARDLSFEHPATKKVVTFHAPLPADMQAAIEKIRAAGF
jgi:23S rRNA pseudouridine1911/1915/1917 synthase